MRDKKRSLPSLPEGSINMGFDTDMVELLVSQIAPIKVVAPTLQASAKYKQILSSIREIGIIEPPVVVPEGRSRHRFILLDGHLRIHVLKELGIDTVTCMINPAKPPAMLG